MRNVRCLIVFLIIINAAAFKTVCAQQAQTPHRAYLNGATVQIAENARRWADSLVNAGGNREPVQVLINFSTRPASAQRVLLLKNGVRLIDYLPDNTYAAIIMPGASVAALSSAPVYGIVQTQPEWKAGSYLWNKIKGSKNQVDVLVSFSSGIDPAAVRKVVLQNGGQLGKGNLDRYNTYKVTIAANRVRALAQWYGVRYISPVATPAPLDIQSRAVLKGNISAAPPAQGGYGLLGDSVTVGVGDNTSGIFHIDLKDRITNFNPAALTHHGVHINGIAGGAAIIDPLAISLTPHVALLDHYYDLVLYTAGDMYHDYNMTLTNNSYELIENDCSYSGVYDAYSAFLDTFALQYPYVLHVFAAGNDGQLTCSPYPPAFGTVGGGYQPSKNTISVGSITYYSFHAYDDSRGPVRDGRLKPEIVATGYNVYSCIDDTAYLWRSGTSMASPHVVSGLTALTQRYKQLHGGAQPRADVLKTILLDGAEDIGNPGPDFTYGFGVMDMYRSLQILNNNHYSVNTVSDGDSQSVTINIPANTAQVKVMLYWNDAPADPMAAKQLVNDLDLSVLDPSGTAHLPLVPDAAPANVDNNAVEKEDHVNNVEQVTVNAPAAGNYTIKIKGYNVPSGPQPYVVAYDLLPNNLTLTYPIGGEAVSNTDSFRVIWDAVSNGNMFTALFSPDNGVHWTTLSDSIPPDGRHIDIVPAGINSGKCLVRVIRNGSGDFGTSGKFAVNTQPVIRYDAVATAQCPGYINIHWAPVTGAASYYMLRKTGPYMQVVDSTADTAYIFRGMPVNSPSYVAVQPVIDGIAGYRSTAAVITANIGNCTGAVSYGDLAIGDVLAPASGRMYTSTQLGAGAALQVRVRDLYSAPCTDYTLSYKINAGSWQTYTNPGTIPAAGSQVITVSGLPVTATGTYTITAAIHNTSVTDPLPSNDTTSFVIQNLPNDTLDLSVPFTDGFEAMSVFSVTHDSTGVSPNGHWDFFTANDTGRMRSFVFDNVTISGSRSVSMDEWQPVIAGSNNTFTGTFNLGAYDTASAEVRVDFDYLLHGWPKDPSGNVVQARGNDTSPWQPFYTYDLSTYPGSVAHVRSLSLTDVVRGSGRNFSSSTQVSFGQNDTSVIAAPDYGNGITLDNFRLYTVANDAALVKIVTPLPANCELPSPAPLTVQVHNGVNYALHNVQLFYTIDGGAVNTGTLTVISAKATVDFTFPQQLTVAPGTTHVINVWLAEAGDTYTLNDSILNYRFHNNAIISSFPYLETFEAGDGGYYTDGMNDSWQYGTPASPHISKAASGTKAWKTNLTGNYNNLETSYLYTPCFDISTLNNPMLSFSTAMDIENCGNALCDAAYIEYTFDGVTWMKLGAAGQGTNWYDPAFDVWNTEGFYRWHVASVPLPKPPAGGTINLRFVLRSDPGANYEGMAVDDVHIFDLANPISAAQPVVSVTRDISGSQWNDFLYSGTVAGSIRPAGQDINAVTLTLYGHDTLHNNSETQYTFPRSYTVKAAASPADSVGLRLYLTDSDVVNVLADTSCPSCTPVRDAYSLGITQYDNTNNTDAENGSLADDTGGVFTYYPYKAIQWVPYDKGYYAELTVKPFSEFWFNNGGPTGTFPAGADYLDFVAYRSGSAVHTYWYSLIDTAVNTYTLQWSPDSINFTGLLDTPAVHSAVAQYSFIDRVNPVSYDVLYYRLNWTMQGGDGVFYSPVRKVAVSDSAAALIVFNAAMTGGQTVLANWISYIDGEADHYILERAIGTNSYSRIDSVRALKQYGQQYYFTDRPGENIPAGRQIHYRLTAVMADGSVIVLPERIVVWEANGSVVNIYPNPTFDGDINIAWNADAGSIMHVTITDAVGRRMYTAAVTAAQWNNFTSLHTFHHPKGLYFVRLDINGNLYTAKIVYE